MNDLQIIRPKELCRILNIGLSTLYRWHDEGKIPIKKFNVGKGFAGYKKSDVEAWLNGELEEDIK